MTALNLGPRVFSRRRRIAICGGGVAAIEALLGLRALLGLAPHVDLIAPNRRFIYEPLAVAEPFGLAQTRRFELASVAGELGAQLHVASLEAVRPDRGRIAISGGTELLYDRLIVAVGARRCAWLPGALHFTGAADVASFRGLLARLERGELSRVAFTTPARAGWTLPTYELALLTASWVAERHLTGIELTILTPEREPLASFGHAASRAMRDVLGDRGIRLRVDDTAEKVLPRSLRLVSGISFAVDQVVALPRLEGPSLAGLPADDSGFIQVDDHAQVVGIDNVYAAGDATAFPVKQGGVATQQADAAAEAIAASFGAGVKPSAFQPVLRGMLLTGVAPTYLRAAVTDEPANNGELAAEPLWWPPTKIAGRYLGPYLAEAAPKAEGPQLEDQYLASDDSREIQAGHREARELALTFALADANSEDYHSALRWLEVVEQLDGALPPGYPEKRAQWHQLTDR
ncbi:MAG: FAD-dependent oxidoreductase [Solirubrobacteraceae bacterium]